MVVVVVGVAVVLVPFTGEGDDSLVVAGDGFLPLGGGEDM